MTKICNNSKKSDHNNQQCENQNQERMVGSRFARAFEIHGENLSLKNEKSKLSGASQIAMYTYGIVFWVMSLDG